MSDPTAPVEGTSTSIPAEATAPAADPVSDRMNEIASSVGSLVDRFEQFEQRLPQPEQQAEPDPWAALFPEEQEPDQYQQQQPALDPQALQAAINAAIQQSNAPLQAQLQQMQAERAAQQLGQMIPALADTPANQANRQQAYELVQNSLQGYPTEIANALAADPNYIATQWKAAEADRLAAGQVPASGNAPTLESAGGATPGGTSENPIDQAFPAQRKALAPGFY